MSVDVIMAIWSGLRLVWTGYLVVGPFLLAIQSQIYCQKELGAVLRVNGEGDWTVHLDQWKIRMRKTKNFCESVNRECSLESSVACLFFAGGNFAKKRKTRKWSDFGEFPSPEVEKRKNRQISSVFGFLCVGINVEGWLAAFFFTGEISPKSEIKKKIQKWRNFGGFQSPKSGEWKSWHISIFCFLCVGINIESLAALLLLARFCQKEKLQIQNSKTKWFFQFSVKRSEEKKVKNSIFIYFIFSL